MSPTFFSLLGITCDSNLSLGNYRINFMSNLLQNIRIARVSTIPFFVFTQLRAQLEALADAGAQVSIVSSDDELSGNMQMIEGCTFQPVFIAREISFFSDVVTLIKLWKLFRKERFHIVHSTTPKAGLLCAIAAKLASVEICVHTYTGQLWVTMKGIKKYMVMWSDKLIACLNICCYTDSFSQRDFLIKHKIIAPEKLKVIGSGSLAGVNVTRFFQERYSELDRKQLRETLGITEATKVLLFIGRITKEKGIYELIDATHHVLKRGHDVVLLVIGPFEQRNENEIRTHAQKLCPDRVIFTGFTEEPERFMAISELLCLPSYREGFGTVVIEAAAMGLPVVGTKIYGLTDAVIDGTTGILVEPQNSAQLTDALEQLLVDDVRRQLMGEQARKRALKEFDSKHCSALLIDEYIKLLKAVKSKI